MLAFARDLAGETTLAVLNAGSEEVRLELPWSGCLATDALTDQQFQSVSGPAQSLHSAYGWDAPDLRISPQVNSSCYCLSSFKMCMTPLRGHAHFWLLIGVCLKIGGIRNGERFIANQGKFSQAGCRPAREFNVEWQSKIRGLGLLPISKLAL